MEILYTIPAQEITLKAMIASFFIASGVLVPLAVWSHDIEINNKSVRDSVIACFLLLLLVGICIVSNIRYECYEKICVRMTDAPYVEVIDKYEIDERIDENTFIIHEKVVETENEQ